MVGLNEIENYNNNTILDDDNQTQSYDALDLHNPQHQEKHINKYSLRSYSSPANLAVPPPNFSKVSKGIYRSSCPRLQNHEFLKNLGVKSIVYFVPGDYPEENKEFLSSQNINLFHFPTKGNKVLLLPFIHSYYLFSISNIIIVIFKLFTFFCKEKSY